MPTDLHYAMVRALQEKDLTPERMQYIMRYVKNPFPTKTVLKKALKKAEKKQ